MRFASCIVLLGFLFCFCLVDGKYGGTHQNVIMVYVYFPRKEQSGETTPVRVSAC